MLKTPSSTRSWETLSLKAWELKFFLIALEIFPGEMQYTSIHPRRETNP